MVYLDSAATSICEYFSKDYYIPGNPNTTTKIGLESSVELKHAKERIKKTLNVNSGELFFCRCATEAARELCSLYKGPISCSQFEHDSVYDRAYSQDEKHQGIYLQQYVNQITGKIFDLKDIGEKYKKEGMSIGSDCTAAIGHISMPYQVDAILDAFWFSGHKIYAEQGIGAIWFSDDLMNKIGEKSIESAFSGTPNVSSAIAMSYAIQHEANEQVLLDRQRTWKGLYERLTSELRKRGVTFKDCCANKKNYSINSIILDGLNGDALVHFLSSREIYISPGYSACSTGSNKAFRVLKNFGLTKKEAEQTIRISFDKNTTDEDIDQLALNIVNFKEMFT